MILLVKFTGNAGLSFVRLPCLVGLACVQSEIDGDHPDGQDCHEQTEKFFLHLIFPGECSKNLLTIKWKLIVGVVLNGKAKCMPG
jgi:hypothetical protein